MLFYKSINHLSSDISDVLPQGTTGLTEGTSYPVSHFWLEAKHKPEFQSSLKHYLPSPFSASRNVYVDSSKATARPHWEKG